MAQQPLEYRSPIVYLRRNRPARIATAVVAASVLIANGVLLGVAAADKSFAAFAIAIMVGPITNGVLLLVSLACIPLVVKSGAAGGWVALYVSTAIALPLAAVPIDFAIIGSMGLHGC